MLYFSKGGDVIKSFKLFDIILILAFTLLFIFDYFPNLPLADAIPKKVLIFLILGLLQVSLLFKKYRETDPKTLLKWQVFLTLYILTLIVVFPFFGGESTSGISFDSSVLWIVILISLFDIYSRWKKVKQLNA